MKNSILFIFLILLLACSCSKYKHSVEIYTTTIDNAKILSKSSAVFSNDSEERRADYQIRLNPQVKYQEVEGFGIILSNTNFQKIITMEQQERSALLNELFDPLKGNGYSYVKIPIGNNIDPVSAYSYCDSPGIECFAIPKYDKANMFPILDEILTINPTIKILASPKFFPLWMTEMYCSDKNTSSLNLNYRLNPAYYQDYASYIIKYINMMRQEGFPISSLIVQDESSYMTKPEQEFFMQNILAPAFDKAGINTKIVLHDIVNYDIKTGGEISGILADEGNILEEKEDVLFYIAANALTLGDKQISQLCKFPYILEIDTERSNADHANNSLLKERSFCSYFTNSNCKAIMISDSEPGGKVFSEKKSHTNNDVLSHSLYDNLYYEVVHFSKVVRPGAKRIKVEAPTDNDAIYYCAFENIDGSYAIIVENELNKDLKVSYSINNNTFTHTVEAKSINSYYWMN